MTTAIERRSAASRKAWRTRKKRQMAKGGKMHIICAYCGKVAELVTGAVNRARKKGVNLYCGQKCAGRAHRTHGMSGSRTYRIWSTMLARCRTPSQTSFERYGGRGIKVCKRWMKFDNFLADMGIAPDGLELDRYPNNDGDYEPGNCRWTTPENNQLNKRNTVWITFRGETLLLIEWADKLKIPIPLLRVRLRKGWTVDRALLTPLNQNRSQAAKRWREEKGSIYR